MTLAPDRRPLRFESLEEVVAALREAGHRVSAATRQVLESLFAAEGPISAERIAAGDGAEAPLELTSVYRNLERLEQLGVIGHVHVGHGPGLYALTRHGDREYLVCDRCGGVTSLDPGALEAVRTAVLRAFAHHARFSHFPIHGYCDACARAIESGDPDERASTAKRHEGGTVSTEEHHHEHPHSHEHSHGDVVHSHPHTEHDHEHTKHEHEHSHGDRVHSHPHVHQARHEHDHDHDHEHEHE